MTRTIVFLPSIIALLLLVGSPLFSSLDGSVCRGGLVCYCCSIAEQDRPMISCPKCRSADGQDYSFWSPDLVLTSFDLVVFTWPMSGHVSPFPPPETIYLEVPVKPPIRL